MFVVTFPQAEVGLHQTLHSTSSSQSSSAPVPLVLPDFGVRLLALSFLTSWFTTKTHSSWSMSFVEVCIFCTVNVGQLSPVIFSCKH
jgi:hypothetical protein